jgi:hypothetical protein
MPGGFHPFHAGHASLYQAAVKAFPGADVYVAATNSQEERPFPFSIKEKLAKVAGVAPGHFIQVKSPFKAEEITSQYDPNSDVLIFVRSEKDRNESPKPGGTKKDGSPSYFQPYTGKNLQPFSKHAYMAYLPTIEFGPGITSASEIREMWPKLNDKRKTAMVMSLYPATQQNPKLAANVTKLLDAGMGVETVDEGFSMPSMTDIKNKIPTKEGIKNWLLKLKNGLSQEAEESKLMLGTYLRYTNGETVSKEEMNIANEQLKDVVRGLGLGAWAMLPGHVLTVPVVFGLAKKYNIELFPSSFREQPVVESTSKESTLRAVVNDISEPIAGVYNNMLMQAEKYVDNHGALDKGFRLIVAGIGGRWTQNMYINKLKNELYDLCKAYPSQTNDLKDFLSGKEKHGVVDMHKSFSIIAKELPVILERLGRHINSPELSKAAKRWEHNREVYKDYVRDNWDSEEIEVTPPVKKQKSNIIGQQNAVVDKIINDVLAKIKPSDAGSIRNTLANVPINNRLNALQKILSDMNMTVNEKMKMGATIEPIEESNIPESLDYLEEK